MPHEPHPFHGYQFVISLRGSEPDSPEFNDTANFLYDLNLLYELGRLAVDKKYEHFAFNQNAFRRNGRPLRSDDRQVLVRLKQESPIEIGTALAFVAGAPSAIWLLAQAFERLYNIRLNREKTRAEIRKINSETIKNLAEAERVKLDVLRAVKQEWDEAERKFDQNTCEPAEGTEAGKLIQTVTRRISESPIRVTEFRVQVIERIDPPHAR
jgi:hypothetical protein